MAHNSHISGVTMAHKDRVKGREETSSTPRIVGSQTFHRQQERKISSPKDRRSSQDCQFQADEPGLGSASDWHTPAVIPPSSSARQETIPHGQHDKVIKHSHLCVPLLSNQGHSSCECCSKVDLLPFGAHGLPQTLWIKACWHTLVNSQEKRRWEGMPVTPSTLAAHSLHSQVSSRCCFERAESPKSPNSL